MEAVFGFLYKFLLFALVIGFVALIHELGHFLVAKACNVRVDAFAIGMGSQKLWCRTVGETEYSVRIFPVGGFVLLAQEDGMDMDDGRPDPGERSFQRKTLLQKVAILLAGPFMNILGTIGILTLLWSAFGVPLSTLQVMDILDDSPAKVAGFENSDVIMSIDGQEIRKFENGQRLIASHANQEILVNVQRRKNYRVFRDYPQALNFLNEEYKSPNFIRFYDANGKIVKVFNHANLALSELEKMGARDLHLEVSTQIQEVKITVVPDAQGRVGIHIRPYILGEERLTLPFFNALIKATDDTAYLTKTFFIQISAILIQIVRKFSTPDEIGGPVAIAYAVAQGVEQGAYSFLWLTAQICLSIGVFNLIPIPGLDGGRILVIVVKDFVNLLGRVFLGKSKELFNDVIEGYVNIFGVLCVVSLIVLVTYKDIVGLLG
jgi:RIP metalloprotease RseP